MNAFVVADLPSAPDEATFPFKEQSSSIPHTGSPTRPLFFRLKCLGGIWEGYLVIQDNTLAHVHLSGFPPIRSNQRVFLYDSIPTEEKQAHLSEAVIWDLQVIHPSNVSKGSTEFLLAYRSGGHQRSSDRHSRSGALWRRSKGVVWGEVIESTEPAESVTDSQGPLMVSQSGLGIRNIHDVKTRSEGQKGETVHSAPLTITKDNGQRIRVMHDFPHNLPTAELPIVVMAPGYGETKRDYLSLAYYFATNGFQVLRYDHTNHVGESDGRHYEFSLSSMKEDFQTMTRFARRQWPGAVVFGLASSIAARVAVKAEVECPSVDFLVMLVGIVNVRSSVATVHQEDVFAGYLNGQYPDSANILGFNVGKQFLDDACRSHFVTLEETLSDAKHLRTPVMMVSAGKDAWVDSQDLLSFAKAMGPRLQNWMVVPDALHRLQESPKNARETYRQVVAYCRDHMEKNCHSWKIQEPNRSELGRQNRMEKIRQYPEAFMEMGPGFWQDYLAHFQSVGNCPDYLALLDHVLHALGPIIPGQRMLDVGCGNGNAGVFIRQKLKDLFPFDRSGKVFHYVGIDVVVDALKRAKESLQPFPTDLFFTSGRPESFIRPAWAQVDLCDPLPFPDNQFDHIISNLVLGYMKDPQAALRELYRVLAPGGRMVISNLKPDGDFSGIYQRLVSQAQHPRQLAEARELLNNYGKIRQAEKEGFFHFYDREQWMAMVQGLGVAQVYPTFANQAYLIVLEKPAVMKNFCWEMSSSPTAGLSQDFCHIPMNEAA